MQLKGEIKCVYNSCSLLSYERLVPLTKAYEIVDVRYDPTCPSQKINKKRNSHGQRLPLPWRLLVWSWVPCHEEVWVNGPSVQEVFGCDITGTEKAARGRLCVYPGRLRRYAARRWLMWPSVLCGVMNLDCRQIYSVKSFKNETEDISVSCSFGHLKTNDNHAPNTS